jgi:hypothetical protein
METKVRNRKLAGLMLGVVVGMVGLAASAQSLPSQLAGSWKITRVLPTRNTACWDATQAQPLLGSTLYYSSTAMRWHGGEVPLQGITMRMVSGAQFKKENSGDEGAADFTQLGIHSGSVLEVDMQHEDADITGATTEVPGDSVLIAGPNRIIVSACGIFFEARRAAMTTASVTH